MWRSGGARLVCCAWAIAVAGCSGDTRASHGTGSSASASSSSGNAYAGSGSSAGAGSSSFGNAPGSAGHAARTDAGAPKVNPAAANCAGTVAKAEQVEVDMYIMLDRSSSMTETTGTGNTKWDDIRQALTSFVTDSQSDGLGVGLQYFPLITPGVPDTCRIPSECGSGDVQCLVPIPAAQALLELPADPIRYCTPTSRLQTMVSQCKSDADCTLGSSCADVGFCSGLAQIQVCFNPGTVRGCGTDGDCAPFVGFCSNFDSCTESDYQMPAVQIGLLPGNATALRSSLMAEMPTGRTPTRPALSGAIKQAADYAQKNPSHRVIAVLATDGLPTECSSSTVMTNAQWVTDVADVAAQGVAMTPSIETYVIGVFAPGDPNAMQSLDQMAMAGGTSKAFIVDQSGNVSQQLIDALASIRSGALSCEFGLPQAPGGKTLDYNLVNVEFTQNGNTQTLLYVGSQDQCAKAALGWFYDVDPKQGTPTRINTCPSTCTMLQAATNAQVEVRLGCATMGPL